MCSHAAHGFADVNMYKKVPAVPGRETSPDTIYSLRHFAYLALSCAQVAQLKTVARHDGPWLRLASVIILGMRERETIKTSKLCVCRIRGALPRGRWRRRRSGPRHPRRTRSRWTVPCFASRRAGRAGAARGVALVRPRRRLGPRFQHGGSLEVLCAGADSSGDDPLPLAHWGLALCHSPYYNRHGARYVKGA